MVDDEGMTNEPTQGPGEAAPTATPLSDGEAPTPPPPPPPPPIDSTIGAYPPPPPPPGMPYAAPVAEPPHKEKLVAGLLGILLGSLGVHKFYLGYQQEGVIMLLVTIAAVLLSCVHLGWFFGWIPWVIGLVEGIIYLTKSDEEFERTYVVGRRPWL